MARKVYTVTLGSLRRERDAAEENFQLHMAEAEAAADLAVEIMEADEARGYHHQGDLTDYDGFIALSMHKEHHIEACKALGAVEALDRVMANMGATGPAVEADRDFFRWSLHREAVQILMGVDRTPRGYVKHGEYERVSQAIAQMYVWPHHHAGASHDALMTDCKPPTPHAVRRQLRVKMRVQEEVLNQSKRGRKIA